MLNKPKKNFSAGQLQLFIFFLFLIGGLFYYYSVYIPGNERKILTDRYNRMQLLQLNFTRKITEQLSVLRQYSNSTRDSGCEGFSRSVEVDSSNSSKKDSVAINGSAFIFRDGASNPCYKSSTSISDFLYPLFDFSSFEHFILLEKGDAVFETLSSAHLINIKDTTHKKSFFQSANNEIILTIGGSQYLAFIQPVGFEVGQNWSLVGLIKLDTFEKSTRVLPERIFSLFFIILCFVVFALPTIKLFVLGRNERIRFIDLFGSYISLMLCMCCVVLIFCRLSSSLQKNVNEYKSDIKDPKTVLSKQICDRFRDDIHSALTTLKSYDAKFDTIIFLKRLHTYSSNSPHICPNDSTHVRGSDVKQLEGYLSIYQRYDSVKNVFWLNNIGEEILTLQSDNNYQPRSNYIDRSYFQNVVNRNLITDSLFDWTPFTIQPLISRSDNQFKTILAIDSKGRNAKVAVISCKIPSVQDCILPKGFGFAIFDNSGQVLYHSDPSKNMNENFLKSCEDINPIKQTIESGQRRVFRTNYNNSEYDICTEPIANLPGFFIAVFENNSFSNASNYATLLGTFLLVGVMIFFYSIEIILVFIGLFKGTQFKRKSIDYSFIYPKQKMKHHYLFCAIVIFCYLVFFLILFLGIFLNFQLPTRFGELQILSGFSLVQLIYALLFNMIVSTILTLLNFQYSNNIIKPEKYEGREKRVGLFSFFGLILFLSTFYFNCMLFAFLYLLILVIITWFVKNNYPVILRFKNLLESGIGERKEDKALFSFSLLVFMRMALVGGAAVMTIFIYVHDFNQQLFSRYRLYEYAKSVNSKYNSGTVTQIFNNKKKLDFKSDLHAYSDNTWIKNVAPIRTLSIKYDSTLNIYKEESEFRHYLVNYATSIDSLLSTACAFNDQKSILRQGFYMFNLLGSDASKLQYKLFPISKESVSIQLSSSTNMLFPFKLVFTSFAGILYSVILVLGAMGLFILVYMSSSRYFKWWHIFKDHMERNKEIILAKDSHFIHLQGLPGISKKKFVLDLLTDCCTPIVIDLSVQLHDINERLISDCVNELLKKNKIIRDCQQIVVINHFEFDFEKNSSSIFKLILLEKLKELKIGKVIIISTIDQNEFLRLQFDLGTDATEDQKKDIQKLCFRWHSVLGYFTNLYIKNNGIFKTIPSHNEGSIIENEEELIIENEDLKYYFYQNIWTVLTREEKLILLSLCREGLLNYKNEYYVGMLYQKGILTVENEYPEVADVVFVNYILTAITQEKAELLEEELSVGQLSKKFRYPLIALAICLVWLILYGNPDKYGGILPLLSSMTAGITAIFALFKTFVPAKMN